MYIPNSLFEAIKAQLPIAIHEIQPLQPLVKKEYRISSHLFPVIQTTRWKVKKFYKPISKILKGNDL
jgi:hypothetical protein